MAAKYLTLDVGTTAVKVGLFDRMFQMQDMVVKEYTLRSGPNGTVELDPNVYLDNVICGIREIMERMHLAPEEVASITCTTQGETLIPVDQNGNALHDAVVWLDARAMEEKERIARQYPKEVFFEKTGIPEVTEYCPISKLLWFHNRMPEIYEKTDKFLLLEDFLIYKLTGKMVTNPSISCTTGYLDIRTKRLWTDILERNGLDPRKIPEILPCGAKVGLLSQKAALATGLTERTMVTTGAMDQAASAIGVGNVVDGIVSETTGTCMCVAASVKDLKMDPERPVPVYVHAVNSLYLRVSVSQTAGMVLKWFRDAFCEDLKEKGKNAYDAMSALAEKEPPLSRGVILAPFLTGTETDSRVRGAYYGIGLDTTRGCCIRAVMEAVGYTLLEKLNEMDVESDRIYSLGGAADSRVWNQIKADISGRQIVIPEIGESTSRGAALLGALALEDIGRIKEGIGKIQIRESYKPQPENKKLYQDGYREYRSFCETVIRYERSRRLAGEGRENPWKEENRK
ncbi:MAG: hypothetical protein DBX58_08515 [Clostridiales bacterium]|nr:MAG: hypothetical protein DBX58_08515 [Clostridiales bacterium]HJA31346.1 hypothetical protein [Candidatus Eisenbergiella pullicola]